MPMILTTIKGIPVMDLLKSFLPSKEKNMSKQKESTEARKAVLDVSDLGRVFDKFDTNGDGKISAKELEAALSRLGQPPASQDELQMMMEGMDTDGDGLVDAGEFLEYYYADILDADDAVVVELKQAFSVFDLDHDGLISAEELQVTLVNIGEELASMKQCERMIEAFDCDGDGCINLEEFVTMMCWSEDSRR